MPGATLTAFFFSLSFFVYFVIIIFFTFKLLMTKVFITYFLSLLRYPMISIMGGGGLREFEDDALLKDHGSNV